MDEENGSVCCSHHSFFQCSSHKEEKIILDSLDDICVVALNGDFQEHVILLPDVLNNIDEQIVPMSFEDSLQQLKDCTLPLANHQA
jgi:hypothetical protein